MAANVASDFGWFSPADLDLLFSALTKLQGQATAVLVGGQAICFWVDYFDIEIPKVSTPYLTQDADFLAGEQEARVLATMLGAKINIATLDDLAPQIAVLNYSGSDGKLLIIDVLSAIVGVTTEAVRRRSIPVEYNGRVIRILHPMLCLQSRIENLYQLPSKRNGNGVSQAKVAVDVVKRLLEHNIRSGREGLVIDWCKDIKDMALSRAGLYVYVNYDIDILKAVSPENFSTEKFKTLFWPHVVKWVEKARMKRRCDN